MSIGERGGAGRLGGVENPGWSSRLESVDRERPVDLRAAPHLGSVCSSCR